MIAEIIFTIGIFIVAFIFYLFAGVAFWTSEKDISQILGGLVSLFIALCITSLGLVIWGI